MRTSFLVPNLLATVAAATVLVFTTPTASAEVRSPGVTACDATATRQASVSVTASGRTSKAIVCIDRVAPVGGTGVAYSGKTLDQSATDNVCTVAEFRVTARRFAPNRTNQTKVLSSATSLLPGCAGAPQFFAGMFLPESQARNVTVIGANYRVERTEFRVCAHVKSTGASLRCSSWQRG